MKIVRQKLTDELKATIDAGFSRHATVMCGADEKFETIVFIAMEDDLFIGACAVQKFWGALHIKYLFIEDKFRGKKVGTQLMEKAFEFAKQEKCPFAFVETMSFQGIGFYQKLGFVLEFTRKGYAHGTSFHYLRKDFSV